MKAKLTQTTFLFFTLCFVACAQKHTSKLDPRESFDFDHSSILIDQTITIKDVTEKVTGTWIGNFNWLNTSSEKGTYILIIKNDREEIFTITQKIIRKNKEVNIQTDTVLLFEMDDKNYMFDIQKKLT